jgi:hypothetical protein
MKIEGYLYDDRSKDHCRYWLTRVLWESPSHFLAEFEGIREPILIARHFSEDADFDVLNENYFSYLFHQTN